MESFNFFIDLIVIRDEQLNKYNKGIIDVKGKKI